MLKKVIMNKDRIQLEFQQLIHKRNNLVAILIILTSGVIGLIYNLNNLISVILLFIGIPAIIIFAKGLLNIEEKIIYFIKEVGK